MGIFISKVTIKLLTVTKWIGDRVPSKENDLSILFGYKRETGGKLEKWKYGRKRPRESYWLLIHFLA